MFLPATKTTSRPTSRNSSPPELEEQPPKTVADRNVDVDAHPHHVVDVGGEAPRNDREINDYDGRGEIIFRRTEQGAKTDATPEIWRDGDRDQDIGQFDRRRQPGAYAGERGKPEICRRPLGARDRKREKGQRVDGGQMVAFTERLAGKHGERDYDHGVGRRPHGQLRALQDERAQQEARGDRAEAEGRDHEFGAKSERMRKRDRRPIEQQGRGGIDFHEIDVGNLAAEPSLVDRDQPGDIAEHAEPKLRGDRDQPDCERNSRYDHRARREAASPPRRRCDRG